MARLDLHDIPPEDIPKLTALLSRFSHVDAEYIERGAAYAVTTVTMLSEEYYGDRVDGYTAKTPLYRVRLYDDERTVHGVKASFIPYEGIDKTLDGALAKAMCEVEGDGNAEAL